MWKVDQKWNWVKLQSVRTLLRITSFAHRKSHVVFICANSCEKLTKSEVEIDSNIAQNHFHSSQEVISAQYIRKFIWQHARFRRYSPLNTQLPRSDLCRSSKVKDHEVKWNIIYDLLYAFHVNFQAIQSLKNSITSIWPLKVIPGQRSWGKLKDHNIIWH